MYLFLVPCAVGTYFDKESKTCIACPMGTYQSETGQLQCTPCPAIAGRPGVTIGPGARTAADCKGTAINQLLSYRTVMCGCVSVSLRRRILKYC